MLNGHRPRLTAFFPSLLKAPARRSQRALSISLCLAVLSVLCGTSGGAARLATSEVSLAGSTDGCFGAGCTPGASATFFGLTYSNSTFAGTTVGGFRGFGGDPTPGTNINNLGSLTLSTTFNDYTGQVFTLRVTFTAPQGINGSNQITFFATLIGTVISDNVGGVMLDFSNTPVLFTFSDGSASGSFFFSVNDLAIDPGQTVALTGQINGAQQTASTNTNPGTDVSVQPVDSTTGQPSPVTLTFAEVTGGGTTTVSSTETNPGGPLSNQFKLGNPPTFYDITTTAQFTPPVTICVQYPESAHQVNEANLKLMHFVHSPDGASRWENITTPSTQESPNPDTANNIICGVTNSLSPFVVAEEDQPPQFDAPGPVNATATSSAGAAVSYDAPTATDDFDGTLPVNCSPPSGAIFPLGKTPVTCSATDSAGSTTTKRFDVTVTYDWSGFLQPINADGSSTYKLGRIVPVKFQLTGLSAGVTDATATFSKRRVADATGSQVTETETAAAATGGTAFRYDASSGQYVYNWSTQGLQQGTYELRVDLGDGVTTRTVTLKLVK